MKIAFVYDRVNKWGGAERVLQSLHDLYPTAPLYTAVYDKDLATWAKEFEVRSSFLQYIPFAKSHHEFFPWLTPIAFEQFDFSDFDLVISVTSAEAKTIITKPGTIHICYCLTPPRYLWSNQYSHSTNLGFGFLNGLGKAFFSFMAPRLRMWDQLSSQRPDRYITLSHEVVRRIKKLYRKEASVIYPPVDTEFFTPLDAPKKEYYVAVGRLVSYKRFDIIIQACNALKKELVVIGKGNQENQLKKIAGPTIHFIEQVDDELLRMHYREARALICAGVEDFGLTPVEAQACGTPVIAYEKGGVKETVLENKTGVFYPEQTAQSLQLALENFETKSFSPESCQANAQRFSTSRFTKEFYTMVEKFMKNLLV